MTDEDLYRQVYRERFGLPPEHERVTDADRRRLASAQEKARMERAQRELRRRR